MFFNSDFSIARQAGLFIFVLLQSTLVQAQVSDVAQPADSDAAAKTQTADTVVTTAETQAATEAVEASASEGQSGESQPGKGRQQKFSFPRWPEKRSVQRERVPMAPPGPYMSSALTGFSFKEPSFDRGFDRESDRVRSRRLMEMDSADTSMEQFSPDVPWPNHAESPARWHPENGYRYVKPHVNNKQYQVKPYNSPSNYNYGYRRNTVMSQPVRGPSPARSKPVMNNPAY